MSYTCEFCGNNFTKNCSLLYHQRTAKYCLTNRGMTNEKNTCEICNKNFSEKRQLQVHKEKCNMSNYILTLEEKLCKKDTIIEDLTKKLIESKQQNRHYETTIEKLEKQIFQLQSKLENIAIQGVKKSTTTNNNTINLQPLTKEWLESQALLLTEEHLSQGILGLAQFAADNSFKNRLVCTDMARKSLKYKENDGKVSKDPRGKKISKMFFASIEAKAENIIPTMIERIKEEMDDVCGEDGDIFESVCNKMDEIIKVKKGIKHITKGQEHELKEEFTKQLCQLLPNP